MEPDGSKHGSPVRAARWFINTFFHQLILVLSVFLLWTLNTYVYKEDFTHGFFCTLGYLPFMAEGILLLSGDTPWSSSLSAKCKMWLHGTFLGCGVLFSVIGVSIMIADKTHHFEDAHAICGLISMIFCIVAALGGLMVANIKLLKSYLSPAWIKICHICISQIGFLMGIVAIFLALDNEPMSFYLTDDQQILTKVALICVCLYTLTNPAISLFQKVVRAIK